MPDYKKFFEYWHDLYGTGLKIAGWHLNGELEDFDNFFDSAVESMDGVTIRCADESRNRMYRSYLVRVPKRHTP